MLAVADAKRRSGLLDDSRVTGVADAKMDPRRPTRMPFGGVERVGQAAQHGAVGVENVQDATIEAGGPAMFSTNCQAGKAYAECVRTLVPGLAAGD